MIELRWYTPVEGAKVLQYRQMTDQTFYAGLHRPENVVPNMQWSEWKTVPEVVERDVSCP